MMTFQQLNQTEKLGVFDRNAPYSLCFAWG